MQPLKTFHIVPKLPPALAPLNDLVYNLWWSWEPTARKLFRHIDVALWERVNHSPLRMLQNSSQARLLALAKDDDFRREMAEVHGRFKAYMARRDTYGARHAGTAAGALVAYFSAEFGFHESVPNYSGGLGILAGDHCKSASDLGLNFVAVGLLYRHGYFKQQITREGEQVALQLNQNFSHLPITEALDAQGAPLRVGVEILGRTVLVRAWTLAIGRIKLHLLDTDLLENPPEDRAITEQLYGGDTEMRIRQEMILGIGGVRVLGALGLEPEVFHMNEGHSAFLGLERVRQLVQAKSLSFRAALQVVAASSVFTTHTPVPAGNDAFPREMMARYFRGYPAEVGIAFDELMSYGQPSVNRVTDDFSMTILALRSSRQANGVSALHGLVSKGLWRDVWAGVPAPEVPITSITNGIHTKTWAAPEFMDLYTRHLGADWEEHLTDKDFWRRVIDIPDETIWATHQMLKRRLIEFARQRIRLQRERLGESPAQLREANDLLNPEILTVGFARRFATYKRGALLFKSLERLQKLVSNTERPVQFIFAGKSHPKDEPGKKVIQEVYQWTRQPEFQGRVVFLEDYDAHVGRRLYQGVDLWLNNPLRPLEASGTSGMKLPPSGGLNLSVLDGWWCEGYNGKNGWPIGPEITAGSVELQNEVDIESLFHVLETQVVPLYYAKPDGRLPLAWIQLMRESIRSVTPVYNTHRMVTEYHERLYTTAAKAHRVFRAKDCQAARDLADWKNWLRSKWAQVNIYDVRLDHSERASVQVGEPLEVATKVYLGELKPEHVRVEAYWGEHRENEIAAPHILGLALAKKQPNADNGNYEYQGVIPTPESGEFGVNVRVIPAHPNLTQPHEMRLIKWAK